MFDFILQSRIKYFVLGVFCFISLVIILHNRHKISEDEEIRNFHEEIAMRQNIAKFQRQLEERQKNIRTKVDGGNTDQKNPDDFNVQFYSGKQMANEVDSEKQLFQIHTVIIENVANLEAELECKDVFSKFGGKLSPGNQYTFQVTDLFHKRHYWCEAIFDLMSHLPNQNPKFKNLRHRLINLEEEKEQRKSFLFKAYGEGAPRDNNHIYLKLEGAFINGENMMFSKDN